MGDVNRARKCVNDELESPRITPLAVVGTEGEVGGSDGGEDIYDHVVRQSKTHNKEKIIKDNYNDKIAKKWILKNTIKSTVHIKFNLQFTMTFTKHHQ